MPFFGFWLSGVRMATATDLGGRIRTNVSAKQAYDSLLKSSQKIATSQLRISTGRRINQAADDVSGYISSRSLQSKNSSLRTSILATEEARNVLAISQDSLSNIHTLLTDLKEATLNASSGSIGDNARAALGKRGYRIAQQIQLVADSTVFGGQQLLDGNYNGEWVIGYKADSTVLDITVDLRSSNADLNVESGSFSLNAILESVNGGGDLSFGGVTGLDLSVLNDITDQNAGVFSDDKISDFVDKLSLALTNITKVTSYLGGIDNRLQSTSEFLLSQVTNYDAAISRFDDADVAKEQLVLSKEFFLSQTSLASMSQSNSSIVNFFRLLV
jgi:flagellin